MKAPDESGIYKDIPGRATKWIDPACKMCTEAIALFQIDGILQSTTNLFTERVTRK